MIVVGTAGWSVTRAVTHGFPGEGTHLARYARVLRGVEINSSFHRAHSRQTYAKWAAATPPGFRFAVKLPQSITHEARLRRARRPLDQFLGEIAGLGRKLGPLLVQLPPSLEYERRCVRAFFTLVRERHEGAVVCEPRHPSWFTSAADAALVAHRISRVAADPASVAAAAAPGGWLGRGATVYHRLHGSPRMYWSSYPPERIERWAEELLALPRQTDCWCMFDNTAGGAAIENALQMEARVNRSRLSTRARAKGAAPDRATSSA
jgi:uncharacterized protein YecE (DUF72 family)